MAAGSAKNDTRHMYPQQVTPYDVPIEAVLWELGAMLQTGKHSSST